MDQPLLFLYLPGPRCIPTTATAALLQKEEAPNPVSRELGRESEWMGKESPLVAALGQLASKSDCFSIERFLFLHLQLLMYHINSSLPSLNFLQ